MLVDDIAPPFQQPLPTIEATLLAVAQTLKDLWRWRNDPSAASLNVVFNQADNQYEEVQTTAKPQLPFASVTIATMSGDSESYNKSGARKTGIPVAIADNRVDVAVLHWLPVNLQLTVKFQTFSLQDILKWATSWLERMDQIGGTVKINTPAFDWKIVMKGATDVTLPTSPGETKEYTLEIQLDVKTISGWLEMVPMAKRIFFQSAAVPESAIGSAIMQEVAIGRRFFLSEGNVANIRDGVVVYGPSNSIWTQTVFTRNT